MNWTEYLNAVRVHMPAHARRQGIQAMIDSLIAAGVWDLRASIPFYQQPITRTFKPSTLRVKGYAATGTLPPGSKVTSVYNREEAEDVRYPYLIATTPEEASQMITGAVSGQTPRRFHYDPRTGVFLVTPSPKDDLSQVVITFYTNGNVDFDPTDDVTLDEKSAEVISYFVQSRIALNVDRDISLAQTYSNLYGSSKRKMLSDLNPATLVPKQTKES